MDRKLITLLSLFFVAFAVFTGVVVFNKPLTKLTRAKEELLPSIANSLVFAWPLKIKADGTETASVTVFVRTENSRPIANKPVNVKASPGTIKETAATSDTEGKASFTFVCTQAGTAEIQAMVDSVALSQRISIKCE